MKVVNSSVPLQPVFLKLIFLRLFSRLLGFLIGSHERRLKARVRPFRDGSRMFVEDVGSYGDMNFGGRT